MDALSNIPLEIRIGAGYVRLTDVMPRIIPVEYNGMIDLKIPTIARTSTTGVNKSIAEDIKLIEFLYKNEHMSPFEFIEFEFELVLPIFVDRQLARHRTASVNEFSGRYSKFAESFAEPSVIRKQAKVNRQGSDGTIEDPETLALFSKYMKGCHEQYQMYEELLAKGVAKEQARIGLPLNLYTKKMWKMDLRNLLHFLELRTDEHAQLEIREYADAIRKLIEPLIPNILKVFNSQI